MCVTDSGSQRHTTVTAQNKVKLNLGTSRGKIYTHMPHKEDILTYLMRTEMTKQNCYKKKHWVYWISIPY